MPWLLSAQGRREQGGMSLVQPFGVSADPLANRRRIFPGGPVLPEALHKGHGMSDIFHPLGLILPWMCGTYRSLKSLCFLSPGGGVFLCKVSALSLVTFPLPEMVGAWLGSQSSWAPASTGTGSSCIQLMALNSGR